VAEAFAVSAARYYAYMRYRRFLDFSTSQSELMRLFRRDKTALERVRERLTHLVVDEVQDVNVVQDRLVRAIVGDKGRLMAVGDHRQAIFAWRGARVDLMARLHEELKADREADADWRTQISPCSSDHRPTRERTWRR
jgi:DNA helicase-2/ATP-dependent DNA helicase PcrA